MIPLFMVRSRVTETSAGSTRVIGAFKTTSLDTDPYLASMFSALEPLSTKLSAAINHIKPDSTLEEADDNRDDKGRGTFYLVSGLCHHPSKKIKEAAQKVEALFNEYGFSMFSENYATESALLISLLLELAKPEMQEAIAVIPGAADMVVELQEAQDYFEQTRIAWEQEKAEDGTKLNATELKSEVLDIINGKIVVYMRAMEIVAPDTHAAFARTLAEIINDNNEVVKKRMKKEKPLD